MNDVVELANVIYGEAAGEDFDTMRMVGSTILNRFKSGRNIEFGYTIPEIIQKGYYAAINQNEPYQQALSQKFPDKNAENKYKTALQIASGLYKGTIEPQEGMFYFTDKEIRKMQKNKSFDFGLVREINKTGKYRIFSY